MTRGAKTSEKECPYRKLGDMLLERLGDRPLSWLADESVVSCGAVSLWLSGKCCPTGQRLGFVAAILGFNEIEFEELVTYAERASNGCSIREKAYRSYEKWHEDNIQKKKREIKEQARQKLIERFTNLVQTDLEFKRFCRSKDPECIELVYQIEGG